MFKKTLLGAIAATAFALPAAAQDYVVGVTAALTGPPSSTYAPAVDAMRLYIDRVNAAGGVNGRKIKLVIEDDGAQPSKAAANTKKLITQDNVVLMVNASLSSTYAPVIAETKSAEVPLLFASGVCPQSVYPPADPLQFCTTGYAVAFRQPGDARLHQGDRERPGEDRLLGDGDSALTRRDGLRHGAVEEDGHGAG